MDYDKEIRQLAGETIALSRVLTWLIAGLSTRPELLPILREALDGAAGEIENIVIVNGAKIPPEHGAHALRVIEDIRRVSLGHTDKPKGGV